MTNRNTIARREVAAGFALPAVLIVVAALLIMAVGVLLVTGIERSTEGFAIRGSPIFAEL